MATGFVNHELYYWHNTGNFAGTQPYGNPVQPDRHVEDPETKRRLRNLLDVSGLLDELTEIRPRPATDDELLRVHPRGHLDELASLNDTLAADAGSFTPVGRGSYDIAVLSAGGVLAAVDAVLDDDVDNAYALVRPPGHHALAAEAMGFCLPANAAVAGRHALVARGLERIAFVDIDVHHGNGTEAIFWDTDAALTISLHQDDCFPRNSGHLTDIGTGPGEGYNLNIPLPPGSGVGAHVAAVERIVVPALVAYRPELIIVPCGFDGGINDPLGRQMMTSDGYRGITRLLLDAAADLCGGRLVACHEGGYSAPTVPFYGLAVIEELSGIDTGAADPFLPMASTMGGQELQPHQAARIDEAIAAAPLLG